MRLQWSVNLAVGVTIIDNQHIELFNRFNGLLDALGTDDTRQELASVINFLEDYVVTHFGMEEEVMDRYSYGAASAHKQAHSMFVAQFASFKEQFTVSGFSRDLASDLLTQMGEWLMNHVGGSDRELGSYLRVAMMLRKAA